MELKARIPLELSRTKCSIELKYDTFVPASFDKYLVAAIKKYAKSKKEASAYIDDITGNGDLNQLFKNEFDSLSELTADQIDSILENSLYPTTVIDKEHYFIYYPELNCSIFMGNVYAGNLKNNQRVLIDKIQPKSVDCKFKSLDIEDNELDSKIDNYDCVFSDSDILVDVKNNNFYKISSDDFALHVKIDNIDESYIRSKILSNPSEGSWFVLTNILLNSLNSNEDVFISSDNNYCRIDKEYIYEFKILKAQRMYFYNEKSYKICSNNKSICDEAVKRLIYTAKLYKMSEKDAVKIIGSCTDLVAQSAINEYLYRKKSNGIANVGLQFLRKGLENNWSSESLKLFKDNALPGDFNIIYPLASHLIFNINELLNIDDDLLSENDLKIKQDYLNKLTNLKHEIDLMIGEITNSGVREKMKSLKTKDVVCLKLKKFMNEYIGHNKKNYNDLSLEALEKEYKNIKHIYDNEYQKVLERCKKL